MKWTMNWSINLIEKVIESIIIFNLSFRIFCLEYNFETLEFRIWSDFITILSALIKTDKLIKLTIFELETNGQICGGRKLF